MVDDNGNRVSIGTDIIRNKKEVHVPFTLDGYLRSNLENVYKNVRYQDYDSFIVVSGREGFGKSTFAGQIATFLDPTFNLDRCTFTAGQFIEACENANKFEAVVFDETMGYLSSRGAMSKFNRQLIQIFSEMRSKNLFVVLCIPNFFELDRYPAMHRSTGLLHVNKRGRFGSYDYRKKKQLYLLGKKTYSYVISPSFTGNFREYFVYPKKKYEDKKQTAIREWEKTSSSEERYKNQRDILIKWIRENNWANTGDISNILDISLRNTQKLAYAQTQEVY